MSRALAASAVAVLAVVGSATGAWSQGLMTAVAIDLDGVRQALLRGNGAPIHTLDNAFYKAYSAASLTLARKEDSTKAVADRIGKNPPSTVPRPRFSGPTIIDSTRCEPATGPRSTPPWPTT